MRWDLIRPWIIAVRVFIRRVMLRHRSCVSVGYRSRVGRSCDIKLGKRAQISLGDKAVVRSGCILDLGRAGSLKLLEQAEIRHYSIIECAGNVTLGKRSVLGAYNWLQGAGRISIGDDVIIGPGVRIVASTHDTSDPALPFARQPLLEGVVEIADNVWIGADVIILTGVRIGKNVIIGAGSLVTHDLAEGGVYVGSPARRIKDVHSHL